MTDDQHNLRRHGRQGRCPDVEAVIAVATLASCGETPSEGECDVLEHIHGCEACSALAEGAAVSAGIEDSWSSSAATPEDLGSEPTAIEELEPAESAQLLSLRGGGSVGPGMVGAAAHPAASGAVRAASIPKIAHGPQRRPSAGALRRRPGRAVVAGFVWVASLVFAFYVGAFWRGSAQPSAISDRSSDPGTALGGESIGRSSGYLVSLIEDAPGVEGWAPEIALRVSGSRATPALPGIPTDAELRHRESAAHVRGAGAVEYQIESLDDSGALRLQIWRDGQKHGSRVVASEELGSDPDVTNLVVYVLAAGVEPGELDLVRRAHPALADRLTVLRSLVLREPASLDRQMTDVVSSLSRAEVLFVLDQMLSKESKVEVRSTNLPAAISATILKRRRPDRTV